MTLRAAEIAIVVADLDDALGGHVLRRAYAAAAGSIADERGFVLELWGRGRTRWLVVSLHPTLCRIHLARERPARAVSGFVRTVHAALAGLSLRAVEQIGGDRAVYLRFGGAEEPGTRAQAPAYRSWSLAIELTGRHANAFLLDAGGVIRSSYAPSASRKRALLWGMPYQPPLPVSGAPWMESPSRFAAAGIHEAIEDAYADLSRRAAEEARRAAAARIMRADVGRLERLVANLRAELAEAAEAETFRRRGELLKPVAARLRAGLSSVRVVDYFDPAMPEVNVPLDPALDGSANLLRYFSAARRLARRPAALAPRLAGAERDLAAARARLTDPVALDAVAATTAGARAVCKTPRSEPRERLPYRLFRSADGHDILVGRSARDNDRMTFQIARGDDAWLHVAGAAGSHVVVRLPRGRDPTEAAVRDAAMLAIHYSKLSRAGQGEVYVTRRKYVRRVRGGAPGQVAIGQERRVWTRVDRAAIERLLGR